EAGIRSWLSLSLSPPLHGRRLRRQPAPGLPFAQQQSIFPSLSTWQAQPGAASEAQAVGRAGAGKSGAPTGGEPEYPSASSASQTSRPRRRDMPVQSITGEPSAG